MRAVHGMDFGFYASVRMIPITATKTGIRSLSFFKLKNQANELHGIYYDLFMRLVGKLPEMICCLLLMICVYYVTFGMRVDLLNYCF